MAVDTVKVTAEDILASSIHKQRGYAPGKGSYDAPLHCPISLALNRKFPQLKASTGGSGSTLRTSDGHGIVELNLGAVGADFTNAFDTGRKVSPIVLVFDKKLLI